MFGFGKNKKITAIRNVDDLKRLQSQNGEDFGKIVTQLAEEGNLICQKFIAQTSMHLFASDDPQIVSFAKNRYVKFATLAAELGDVEEQFNLGLFYIKEFDSAGEFLSEDDLEKIKVAAFWIRQAADAGFEPALDCVDDIEALAERRYSESDIEVSVEDEKQEEAQEPDFVQLVSTATEQIEFDRVVSELAPANFGDVAGVIQKIGFERAIRFYAHLVRLRIPDDRVRYQFILEELDSARQGNSEAQAFARQSGIPVDEYLGALNRSFPEVDGPEGPQQLLLQLCMQVADDKDLLVELRTSIVGRIMEDHGLKT